MCNVGSFRFFGPKLTASQQTLKLYKDTHDALLPTYASPIQSNVSYGPAERNVLDVRSSALIPSTGADLVA
jgi:hypothetical protein